MAHRRSALHARPQSLRRPRSSRTVLFATSSIHILAPAAGCSEPVPTLVICSGCRPCVARQGRRGKPGLCPVQVPRAAHRFSAVAGPCEAGALGEARALSRASTECCTAPQVREQFAESRQVCRNFEVESARDCQSLPNARRKSHPARRTCRSIAAFCNSRSVPPPHPRSSQLGCALKYARCAISAALFSSSISHTT